MFSINLLCLEVRETKDQSLFEWICAGKLNAKFDYHRIIYLHLPKVCNEDIMEKD